MNPALPINGFSAHWKLLGVAVVWGGTWVAGRIAVVQAPPLTVATWRFLSATLALGLLLRVREPWPRWTGSQWLGIAALGASGIFLYTLCFLHGLRSIEAGRGALVVALTPAVIALADWLLFGARMSGRRVAAIFIALAGCIVVVARGDLAGLLAGSVGQGELLILGCVALWATYTFISRHVGATMSPLAATFGASLTGCAMLALAAAIDGSLFALVSLHADGWSSILFLGVFGTALGFTWYAEGIAALGATRAGMFISLVPVFGVFGGVWLLGERLALSTLTGGALVFAGVMLLNLPETTATHDRNRFDSKQGALK